jgi:UDP-glucuronate 4-epimerase
MKKKKILVTGSAGFIGFHLCKNLMKIKNLSLVGIDNINNYYDVKLKKERISILKNFGANFKFIKIDLNSKKIKHLFFKEKFDVVIHLAAQAGVRYSISNPEAYVINNLNGFFNIINESSKNKIKHFIFASTSSVYGDNSKFPLKEHYNTDKPLTFYAATKKSNEVMAYSYSNIHKLPSTCLRFFTVYGPYGRPDMALYKFANSILKNKFLNMFNYGKHKRDFTYIDDVTNAITKIISKPSKDKVPYQVFNIASSSPENLKKFLRYIENNLNKKAKIKYLPLQKGDIYQTFGDTSKLKKKTNFKIKTSLEEGISKYVNWFLQKYKS